MARQPGNPIDPPRSAPLFSGWLCPRPFHWEPRMTSCGEGVVRPLLGLHLSPSGSTGGGGDVELKTCALRNLPPHPLASFQSKRFGAGMGYFPTHF